MTTAASPPLARALTLMVLSSASFSVMGVCMKFLGGSFGAAEVVFFRCLISLGLTLAVLGARRRLDARSVFGLGPRSRAILVLRGLSGLGALGLYVTALLRIRYADAAALLYTSPLFTAVFAHLALGEALRRRAGTALLLGFAGSALVLRPQLDVDPVGGLCALGSGVLSGIAYTSVRAASRHERVETIVLWFAAIGTALPVPVMLPVFVWPDAAGWGYVAGMGVAAQVGQILLTQALAAAPAGTVSVGAFATIAMSAVWGAVLFAEPLSRWTAAGACCIVAGILLLALQRRPRR
ncbi:MAG: DMT family transporter [Planctomycetes bacterium]|nr:DMT family transporter [Planctomycetota bacterium]